MFGYVTTTIASHFLGLGRPTTGAPAGTELTAELHSLREEIACLRDALATTGASGQAGDPAG